MDAYWLEWLNLVLRWSHMTVGVAWIGASFYFNWLEHTLDRRQPANGIAGELWAVHGGGFYHLMKYEIVPEKLPERLHWFKWEAYSTWLTGIALLAVIYYFNADAYLLQAGDDGLSTGTAIALGIGILVAGWIFYDLACRSRLVDKGLLFATVLLIFIAIIAWGLAEVFNGRAAYIHVGALIGTMMVGNVFRVIIPSQRAMVDAMRRGEKPDSTLGKAALRRSTHNNYLTLPVLFIMVSNHYPSTFGHAFNWVVLLLLAIISIYVRHFFNLKNQGKRYYWMWLLAAIAVIALAFVSKPQGIDTNQLVSDLDARTVIARHCANCHARQPIQAGFTAAPNGMMLETAEQIDARLADILQRAVLTRTMPLGNLTGMTEEERTLLGSWIVQKQRGE